MFVKRTACFVRTLLCVAAIAYFFACSDDSSNNVEDASDDGIPENLESSSSQDDESSSSEVSTSSSSSRKSESSSSQDEESSSSKAPKSSSSVESSSSANKKSSAGSKYDEEKCTLKDLRDGQIYRTATIGTQIWMAENLNYETASGSYCYGDHSDCSEDRLYTWTAAVGKSEDVCGGEHNCDLGEGYVRGVCPKNWHLPSKDEWNILFDAVGDSTSAGYFLKSKSGWSTAGNGIDIYGFTVKPTGARFESGNYEGIGKYAYFWSSTELKDGYASGIYFFYPTDYGFVKSFRKDISFSVRCVKD